MEIKSVLSMCKKGLQKELRDCIRAMQNACHNRQDQMTVLVRGSCTIFKTAGLCSQLFSSCGPVNSSSDGKYDVFALSENVKIFEAEFAGSQCKW